MTKHEPQGDDDVWCAIAITEHGRIPGKAKDGTCWYGYGGEEHSTDNFIIMKNGKFSRTPEGTPSGEQNDGSGFFWCAVANTENGRIPGKADVDGNCWYSWGGEELQTDDFRYVCESPSTRKPQGWQNNDGKGLWCAVANTPQGQIPGKCRDGTCWYSYGGEEIETDDFEIVKYAGISEEPRGSPQAAQDDGVELYCAVAQTEHGRIPAKATADGGCWYAFGGEEFESDNFRFVYKRENKPQGDQDGMPLWCAIARTDDGAIPGKSDGENCWYSYSGEEKDTTNFIIVKDGGLGSEPVGSPQGIQLDGAGEMYCAVANTEWGKIPGKAKNGTCWFPYGGEEHETDDFQYVFSRKYMQREPRSMNEWDDFSCSEASWDDSDDEDDVPTTTWNGTYFPGNSLTVDLQIGDRYITGSGEDNGNGFEIDDGVKDCRSIKFVMKLDDGDKYYWGEMDRYQRNIFGKISSDGFDSDDYAMACLARI